MMFSMPPYFALSFSHHPIVFFFPVSAFEHILNINHGCALLLLDGGMEAETLLCLEAETVNEERSPYSASAEAAGYSP